MTAGGKRADSQLSGLAGEFFVAAELLKRGLQTSVTFGNAKSIDLLAHNPVTGRAFAVQVKSLRTRSFFPLTLEKVESGLVYVFVILNRRDQAVRYFIVPGDLIVSEPERFGSSLTATTFPGLRPRVLDEFEDNWAVFDAID